VLAGGGRSQSSGIITKANVRVQGFYADTAPRSIRMANSFTLWRVRKHRRSLELNDVSAAEARSDAEKQKLRRVRYPEVCWKSRSIVDSSPQPQSIMSTKRIDGNIRKSAQNRRNRTALRSQRLPHGTPWPDVFAPKPFLRWAGGKQKLVNSLLEFVPRSEDYERYFEPFFGGGAVYFAVRPKRAIISDINNELINCYQEVRRNPAVVASLVRRYARKNSPKFFYETRSEKLDQVSGPKRAARFIYLNKAAFNGIYRVNTLGQFNVPYGPSENGPAIPSEAALVAASRCLRRTSVVVGDFERVLRKAKRGDFIYLDPPYPPRSDTAYFVHYCADRFGWEEQLRVAKAFKMLAKRGCKVMLSNADQKKVVALYKRFRVHRLGATRWLGSNGDRFRVREIVVTNYDPGGSASSDKRPCAKDRSKSDGL
jgi:DNA adenine methylase